MMVNRSILAATLLILLAGCDSSSDLPTNTLNVELKSDTAWVWQGGGRDLEIEITSERKDEIMLTYHEPGLKMEEESTMSRGTNLYRVRVHPSFYSTHELKSMKMTFSQEGSEDIERSILVGVGGTRLNLTFLTAPNSVERMNFFVFEVKTHAGATVQMQDPINDRVVSSGPVMSDGVAHFQGSVFSDVPLGTHAFRFIANHPNFESDSILVPIQVVE